LIRLDYNFKRSFFSDDDVKNSLDKRTARVFARFGYFVRQAARKLIKKRNRKSLPGEAPTDQTGLLKQHIYFGYDKDGRTLVVGPAAIFANSFIPERLEYGETYTNKKGETVTLKPRPYMRPAYEEKEPYLADLWRKSVV
jgi:hypothetical protein